MTMEPAIKMILGADLWTPMLLPSTALLAQGTAFNYQGRLDDGGSPVNGA